MSAASPYVPGDRARAAAVRSVERILRVDHAGECGAIRIYRSQLAIARVLQPQCVPMLSEMLSHELRPSACSTRC